MIEDRTVAIVTEKLLGPEAYQTRDEHVALIGHACRRGMDLEQAAAVALGVAAKSLRIALGPADAARVVRAMADQVETDTRPAGRQ